MEEKAAYPRSRSLLLVCGLAALTVGCSLAPKTVLPDPPTPTSWLDEDAEARSAALVGWREFFADAALQATISRALENNRDLRIALLRVEEARAAYRVQRADRLPTINGQIGAGRGRTSGDLSITGLGVTTNQYEANLNLSWELDFWGRVRSLEGAALQRYLATEAASQAARISLISAVAETWLQLRELDERILLADQTVETRREAARIARRRSEVGAASRFDMIQTETLLTQAEGEKIALVQAREQTANALALLIGAPNEEPSLPLSSVEQALSADPPPGLPSELLATRPDIRAAEHNLRSADADIGAARAAFFPRIALTGLYGSASTDLDRLFDGDNRQWTFAGAATAPIFDTGRTRANLSGTRVRREIAAADYERTIQSAFRDVADSLSARRNLTDLVAVQTRTLAALTERSRLANLRYGNGAAAYIEVLDAERDRFAAEQALVSARRALLSSRVALYAALGGGALPDSSSGQTR